MELDEVFENLKASLNWAMTLDLTPRQRERINRVCLELTGQDKDKPAFRILSWLPRQEAEKCRAAKEMVAELENKGWLGRFLQRGVGGKRHHHTATKVERSNSRATN